MIENVELVNFISHRRTSLPLREGVTVFVGKNGAGKSSVIDGITYALYGKHARGENIDLVKDRADSAAVTLEFSSGAKRYRVERKVNKKGQLERSLLVEMRDGSSARQLAAGERKQFGESLTGEVTKILGLNYDQMIIAGIIQQGELDSIIELKAKDLKDLINSAIGIDRLDLAYDSMRDVTDSFRETVRNKYGYDDRDMAKVVGQVAATETELQVSTLELQSVQSELDALRMEERGLEDELRLLEPLKEKAEAVRIRFDALVEYVRGKREGLADEQRTIEGVIKTSGEHLRLLASEQGIEGMEESALREEKDSQAILDELSVTIGGLDVLKGRPAELGRIVRECREAISLIGRGDAIKNEFKEIESRIGGLDSQTALLQSEIGKLQADRATAQRLVFKDHTCPICGSKVDAINELFDAGAIDRHLGEHLSRVRRLGEEKQGLNREFKRLQEEMIALARASRLLGEYQISRESDLERLEVQKAELEPKLLALPRMKQEQKDARERKDGAERKLGELRRRQQKITVARAYLNDHKISSDADVQKMVLRRDELARIMQSIPQNLQRLRKLADVEVLTSLSIDEHSGRLVQQVQDLYDEASRFDEAAYLAKLRALDEIRRVKIPDKSGEAGKWKNKMDEAGKNLTDLKATLIDLQRVSEFTDLLEKIRSRVYHRDGAVSASVRSWALGQLSKKASEYARLFGIGVSSITIKEDRREMVIECYGPRGHVKTSSMSGGEKVAIALSLRFALAYVMGGYKLDFIILDEPTVHLDAERKSSLVNIISRLGGEDSPLKQIIIITHDSEIFENADIDQVWRFESTSEGSNVTTGTVS
ncbi:MAG: SMC family ATPase [Thaumarchaeota archaeon]|nr:SMC family ATPase [Nitrososphaerota archaeon]